MEERLGLMDRVEAVEAPLAINVDEGHLAADGLGGLPGLREAVATIANPDDDDGRFNSRV